MESIPNPQNTLYLQASESYCKWVFSTGKFELKTKPMKYFEKTLYTHGWVKIHRSFLVNPNYVKAVSTEIDFIVLNNGTTLPIARRQRRPVSKFFISNNQNICN